MSLTLEIVTPVGVVYRKGELDAVTLPASDGEIQILPGHIPLITMYSGHGFCSYGVGDRRAEIRRR